MPKIELTVMVDESVITEALTNLSAEDIVESFNDNDGLLDAIGSDDVATWFATNGDLDEYLSNADSEVIVEWCRDNVSIAEYLGEAPAPDRIGEVAAWLWSDTIKDEDIDTVLGPLSDDAITAHCQRRVGYRVSAANATLAGLTEAYERGIRDERDRQAAEAALVAHLFDEVAYDKGYEVGRVDGRSEGRAAILARLNGLLGE